MDYGDIIEYLDETYDPHFNEARSWAREHNTSFEELMDRRDLPKRYFQIGQPYTPTDDDLKEQVRAVRNAYLSSYDFTQLNDAPFTEEEKEFYREYRQYLRDYTAENNWWLKDPDTYDQWLLAHHPVEIS